MSEERVAILKMVEGGKITADEALNLLEALEDDNKEQITEGIRPAGKRFLRIKVNNSKTNVNVNIPLALIKAFSKLIHFGMGFIPEKERLEMLDKGIDIKAIDFDKLVSLIDEGLVDGKLVDVDAEIPGEGKTKVEVYVE